MRGCVAKKCPNSSPLRRPSSQADIIMFNFPHNDRGRLKKWIKYTGKKDWIPKEDSQLCSIHFSPDCFIHKGKFSRPTLSPEAIPAVVYPRMNTKRKRKKSQRPRVTTVTVTARTIFFKVADPKDVSHDHLYGIPDPVKTTAAEVDICTLVRIPDDEVPIAAATVEVVCRPQPFGEDVPSDDEPIMAEEDIASSAKAVMDAVHSVAMTERHPASFRHSTDRAISGESKKNSHRRRRMDKGKLERQSKRIRKLKQDVKDLWSLVCELKEKLYISSSCDVLGTARGRLAREILLRSRADGRKAPLSNDLLIFASRLYQHSAKAYDFVRAHFDHVLPDPTTLAEVTLHLKPQKVVPTNHFSGSH